MTVFSQGTLKAITFSSAFLMAASSMGSPSLENTDLINPAATEPSVPNARLSNIRASNSLAPIPAALNSPMPGLAVKTPPLPQPPEPAPLDVRDVVEEFRHSFLQRVATGKQTAFNACFTRTGRPVSQADVDLIRNGAFRMRNAAFANEKINYILPPIVVLDPGHNSEGDPGAIANGLREVDVIDAVAVKLKESLRRAGADVVGTRAPVAPGVTLSGRYRFKDQDRALQWRAEMTHRLSEAFPERPVLAVSLHADASSYPEARGAGVFYYAGQSSHSAPSQELAQSVARYYRTPAGSHVKAADLGFARCQNKDTPVILLELGFITNKQDHEYLRDAARNERSAEKIAGMIAKGITHYIDRRRDRQSAPQQINVAAASAPELKL